MLKPRLFLPPRGLARCCRRCVSHCPNATRAVSSSRVEDCAIAIGSGGCSVAFAPGLSPALLATFPVPARQTGRAGHPAFDRAFAHEKPAVLGARRVRPISFPSALVRQARRGGGSSNILIHRKPVHIPAQPHVSRIVRKAGQRKAECVRGERRYANAGQDARCLRSGRVPARAASSRRPAPADASSRRRPWRDETTWYRSRAPGWRPSPWGWCDAIIERHDFTSLGATGPAEFLQPARQRDIGIRMEGRVVVRPRPRRRQDEAQAIGPSRQHLPRRRQTQLDRGIAPALGLAEPACQRRAAALSRIDSFPRHRVRRKLM